MVVRRAGTLLGLSLLGLLRCSPSDDHGSNGGLVLQVSSDLSSPKDINKVVLEVVTSDGKTHSTSYPILPEPGGKPLPMTLDALPAGAAGEDVLIRLSARRDLNNGEPPLVRVVREARLTIPNDHVGLLSMPLSWLCDGHVKQTPAGDYTSDCSDGDTCVAGTCKLQKVTLEVYTAGTPSAQACMNVTKCFEASLSALPDANCTLAVPKGWAPQRLNVAVRPSAQAGQCRADDSDCFVVLDRDAGEGWTLANGRVQLPRALCAAGQSNLQGVALSGTCQSKAVATPLCGPWTPITVETEAGGAPGIENTGGAGGVGGVGGAEPTGTGGLVDGTRGGNGAGGSDVSIGGESGGEGAVGGMDNGSGGTLSSGGSAVDSPGGRLASGGVSNAGGLGATGGTITSSGGSVNGGIGGTAGGGASNGGAASGGTASGGSNAVSACTFSDPALEAIVRGAAGIATDAVITDAIANSITTLSDSSSPNSAVKSLKGIECLKKLTNLTFNGSAHAIGDLSPLASLSELAVLELLYSANPIKDLTPLGNNTALTNLGLGCDASTGVTLDLSPLAALKNLKYLDIWKGLVHDLLPLANLPLTNLQLFYDDIESIQPLSKITTLQFLSLNSNHPLTDISFLRGLTNLTSLSIEDTAVTDFSVLTSLTALQSLSLGPNSLPGVPAVDLSALTPLSDLPTLYYLDVDGPFTNTAALRSFTRLSSLSLRGGSTVSDLSPIAALTNLNNLYLWGLGLKDIGPLAALTKLYRLDIGYNYQIADLSPLAQLNSLAYITANYNAISDLRPLAQLPLRQVDLSTNQITDLSPLAANTNWTQGSTLNISNNPLDCTAQAANLTTLRKAVSVTSSCP